MDSELDRTLNVFDEQSCREFEAFLDSLPEQEPAKTLDWHGMEPFVRIDIPDKWPWEVSAQQPDPEEKTDERD